MANLQATRAVVSMPIIGIVKRNPEDSSGTHHGLY
ncbi:hypothetical protein ACNKHV_20315 [Shigella flexneri]